jgi:hypothetical protein
LNRKSPLAGFYARPLDELAGKSLTMQKTLRLDAPIPRLIDDDES